MDGARPSCTKSLCSSTSRTSCCPDSPVIRNGVMRLFGWVPARRLGARAAQHGDGHEGLFGICSAFPTWRSCTSRARRCGSSTNTEVIFERLRRCACWARPHAHRRRAFPACAGLMQRTRQWTQDPKCGPVSPTLEVWLPARLSPRSSGRASLRSRAEAAAASCSSLTCRTRATTRTRAACTCTRASTWSCWSTASRRCSCTCATCRARDRSEHRRELVVEFGLYAMHDDDDREKQSWGIEQRANVPRGLWPAFSRAGCIFGHRYRCEYWSSCCATSTRSWARGARSAAACRRSLSGARGRAAAGVRCCACCGGHSLTQARWAKG